MPVDFSIIFASPDCPQTTEKCQKWCEKSWLVACGAHSLPPSLPTYLMMWAGTHLEHTNVHVDVLSYTGISLLAEGSPEIGASVGKRYLADAPIVGASPGLYRQKKFTKPDWIRVGHCILRVFAAESSGLYPACTRPASCARSSCNSATHDGVHLDPSPHYDSAAVLSCQTTRAESIAADGDSHDRI